MMVDDNGQTHMVKIEKTFYLDGIVAMSIFVEFGKLDCVVGIIITLGNVYTVRMDAIVVSGNFFFVGHDDGCLYVICCTKGAARREQEVLVRL